MLFYKCPVKLIFGFPCPGCGFTRSLLAFVRLDFAAAFGFYPLFPLIIADFVYLIFREKLKLPKRAELGILIANVVLILGVYFLRMCLGILPD